MSTPRTDEIKAAASSVIGFAETKSAPEAAPAASAPKDAAPAPAPAPAKEAKEGKDALWSEQLKKFAFAAVGAVNVSQDDVKGFVKKLVEKGELAKKDGEKIIKGLAEKVQKTVKRDAKAAVAKAEEATEAVADKAATVGISQEKLGEKINASIERMLHGMNIATRKDVEELGKQLDELDKKVARLVEAAASGRPGTRKPAPAPSGSAAV